MRSTRPYEDELPPESRQKLSSGKLAASTASGPSVGAIEGYGPDRLIGGSPIWTVKLGGVAVRCLVDTGSQVTTVTEQFYRQHLQQHVLKDGGAWLTIRAADGLIIPYLGYFEADVEICGKVLSSRGILVVKDSHSRRALLGMNVLAGLPDLANCLSIKVDNTPNKPGEAGEDRTLGFARLSGPGPIRVPA